MELVYLWVEDYKNIKKQGFNFSPNFECEFFPIYEKYTDENGEEKERLQKDCELKITPKENLLKDFFGENINVTAIVGENGSGKSSVLEMIANKHEDYNREYQEEKEKIVRFFAVYLSAETLYVINDNYKFKNGLVFDCKKINVDNKTKLQCTQLNPGENKFNDLVSVFYSDILNKLQINLKNKEPNSNTPFPKNISTSCMLNNIKPTNLQESNYGDYSKTGFQQIYASHEIHQLILVVMLLKDPDKIELPFVPPKIIKIENLDLQNYLLNYKGRLDDSLINELKNLVPKYKKDASKKDFIEALKQNIIISLMLSTKQYGAKTDDITITKLLSDLENKSFNEKVKKILKCYSFSFNIYDTQIENSINTLLKEINKIDEKYFHNNILRLSIEEVDIEFLKTYEKIVLEIDRFFIFRWDKGFHPSSGEESFLYQFSRFRHYIKDYEKTHSNMYIGKNKNLIILIDEGELTLHPNWQKKYIKNYIDFFTKNKLAKTIHFIFASHSPFILSDVPKENVIFLEKDKETGNCINATNKVNINPFGANIHTLLSHGFFMKEGLMGEFAKSKIDEVIKYLNGKSDTKIKDDKVAQSIVNIIGEPIIKRELQRKLDSKKLSKLDKIDEIEEQMKLLEHRLEIIRKNQK